MSQPIKKDTNLKTSWGKSAQWYDEHLEGADTYHTKVLLPNVLRVLDIEKGERVLELGCGQGFFTRPVQEAGAMVTAVDISAELIKMAKIKEQEVIKKSSTRKLMPVTWITSSVEKMAEVPAASYDKGLMVLALQNVHNAAAVIAEVARTMTANGLFFYVLNHPAFRIPKKSTWGFDETTSTQFRRVDSYLSESETLIEMHPGRDAGKSKKEVTRSFHRSLQWYVKTFAKHGLYIHRLEEWISHKKSVPGPRAKAEDAARKEIPLFMMVELKKIK